MKKAFVYFFAVVAAIAGHANDRLEAMRDYHDVHLGRDILRDEALLSREFLCANRFERTRPMRSLRYDERLFDEFHPSGVSAEVMESVRTAIKYPLAHKWQGAIRQYSYLWFVQQDMEDGIVSKEDFYSQLENYLRKVQKK